MPSEFGIAYHKQGGGGNTSFTSNSTTPAASVHDGSSLMQQQQPMTNTMSGSMTPSLLQPTTPGLHQGPYSTPGLHMNHPTTPFVSTPGMNTNATLPARHATNSSSATMVQTPGMPQTHIQVQTPYQPSSSSSFGPTTPGIHSMHLPPVTPGLMHPTTPGLVGHGYTPMNPTTPGIFGGPKGTPVAVTPHMMAGIGTTPHNPMTPAEHLSGFQDQHHSNGSSGSSSSPLHHRAWMTKGVVVQVTSGEFYNSEGVIVSVQYSNTDHQHTCTLNIRGQIVTVAVDSVNHVIPEKNDNVKILVGEEVGKTGSLIGTDPPDGIVKMDGSAEIKIYPLNHLAKLATG